MTAAELGFESDSLRTALRDALRGQPAELERLFSAMGAVVTAKPNLKLAAAFGAEMAALASPAAPLLNRLGHNDAAPDTNQAFLPIAAAHGWAGRVRAGREVEPAFAALAELAADERAPVRLGTREALLNLGVRPGGADELIERARAWSDESVEDRELRFGSAGLVLELLGERRFLSTIQDHEALLTYLTQVIDLVGDAPRSADRSEARRRLLVGLPGALAAVVAFSSDGPRAHAWMEAECIRADHAQVREALSDAVVRLRSPAFGQNTTSVDQLQRALAGSAKPLRDPSRLRQGLGRGKATRRTR